MLKDIVQEEDANPIGLTHVLTHTTLTGLIMDIDGYHMDHTDKTLEEREELGECQGIGGGGKVSNEFDA